MDFGFHLVGLWILDSDGLVWVGVVVTVVGGVWLSWVTMGLLLLCSSLLTMLVGFKMICGGGWCDYVAQRRWVV